MSDKPETIEAGGFPATLHKRCDDYDCYAFAVVHEEGYGPSLLLSDRREGWNVIACTQGIEGDGVALLLGGAEDLIPADVVRQLLDWAEEWWAENSVADVFDHEAYDHGP